MILYEYLKRRKYKSNISFTIFNASALKQKSIKVISVQKLFYLNTLKQDKCFQKLFCMSTEKQVSIKVISIQKWFCMSSYKKV